VRVSEDVTRAPAGVDASGNVTFEQVWTGRPRRPASVAEWAAQRVAALGGTARAFPAGKAVIALLEAGEDAAVRPVGKPLDEWQRYGVLTELQRLLKAARESYPPAGPMVEALRGRWVRAFGDREPLPRRRLPAPPPAAARPVDTLAASPPDAAHWAAAWGRPLAGAPMPSMDRVA
jgi:hypothetical protein